ncbi:hypothetical protein R5R35_002458 [Gryllus longicercus]|uniref:Accessory gland protein n=1 Tax=Gryllus longicercus TaxID=2509291 RepID=A0AAN9VH16_9ORTH
MNSLLMIIATATVVSALPVPLATVSRYTSPGEIDWYEDGPEDFVATVQIGGDDYAWEAPPSDYEGREELQALYEDVWSPEDVNGGAARRSAAEDELMAVAASGARGFHMRQGAWRRGVRAYDPHHWNRLPRAHHSPHAAQEAAAAAARTQQEIAADPVDDASE